jgi:hypothetical protein
MATSKVSHVRGSSLTAAHAAASSEEFREHLDGRNTTRKRVPVAAMPRREPISLTESWKDSGGYRFHANVQVKRTLNSSLI